MGKLNIDWEYFKHTAITVSIIMLVSATLASGSYFFIDNMREKNRESQQHLSNMRVKYDDAVRRLKLVKEYNAKYNLLAKSGFIGDENRLDWVETLRKITEHKKVPEIKYEIKAVQKYSPPYLLETNLFEINSSEMILKMDLKHEGDLLSVFDELNRRTAGVYELKGCQVKRNAETFEFTFGAVNLRAECSLNWFSIKPVSET